MVAACECSRFASSIAQRSRGSSSCGVTDSPSRRQSSASLGLQAQWPPSPYVGLWSRLDGFTPDQLVRAIARRTVVKATLMRTTLHIVSAADYLAYAGIYRQSRIRELQRQLAALGEDADFAGDGERLAALADEKARTRPELLALLGRPKLRIEERSPWLVWYGLAAHAGLVSAPSSSVWRSHTAGGTFVPARTWLGCRRRLGRCRRREPRPQLPRRLRAGIPRGHRAMDGLRAERRRPWIGGTRAEALPGRARSRALRRPGAPLPSSDVPAPARLLPRFDNLVLSHDDRRRVIADEYRAAVIQGGEVKSTFLVDGFVAGTWSLDGGRVRLEPFAPIPRVARRELEDEAARLEAFVRKHGPSR